MLLFLGANEGIDKPIKRRLGHQRLLETLLKIDSKISDQTYS